MAAQAHGRSDARAVVAEAVTRLRDDLERLIRRRFPTLDAREIYQRAALRALERTHELRDLHRVDAWIRRIALTSALDALRQPRAREVTVAEPPDVASPSTADETCTCVIQLLQSLPVSYADVLRRVDIDGADLDEVASDLHIAKGNAAVRLHRARRALRGRLLDHCGVESMRQCLSCVCSERGCCEAG